MNEDHDDDRDGDDDGEGTDYASEDHDGDDRGGDGEGRDCGNDGDDCVGMGCGNVHVHVHVQVHDDGHDRGSGDGEEVQGAASYEGRWCLICLLFAVSVRLRSNNPISVWVNIDCSYSYYYESQAENKCKQPLQRYRKEKRR